MNACLFFICITICLIGLGQENTEASFAFVNRIHRFMSLHIDQTTPSTSAVLNDDLLAGNLQKYYTLCYRKRDPNDPEKTKGSSFRNGSILEVEADGKTAER